MTVIHTYRWLDELYDTPLKLCEKLTHLFSDATSSDIYDYLKVHGMYHYSKRLNIKEIINTLQKNQVWEIVKEEKQALQKQWDGPSIPIFIFPSDPMNTELQKIYNGKSGLAFKDKLFLFLSPENNETEIKALLTHEYNHVCRLNKMNKSEEQFLLLDSIILEGVAEKAVLDRFGKAFTSSWTTYYSDRQLEKMCKKYVIPHIHVSNFNSKHQELLYGLRFYPKMLGYAVGYYAVNKYTKKKDLSCNDLLHTPAEEIFRVMQ